MPCMHSAHRPHCPLVLIFPKSANVSTQERKADFLFLTDVFFSPAAIGRTTFLIEAIRNKKEKEKKSLFDKINNKLQDRLRDQT